MYIDLHGHVNKMGTFLYGNALKDSSQVNNILFAKLLALNSVNFEFGECNFTEANMMVKDKADGLSREGCSRVAIYKETSLPNCYTIEASFQGSKRMKPLPQKYNRIKEAAEDEDELTDLRSRVYEGRPAVYTPEILGDMGRVRAAYNPLRRYVRRYWITMRRAPSQECLTACTRRLRRLRQRYARRLVWAELRRKNPNESPSNAKMPRKSRSLARSCRELNPYPRKAMLLKNKMQSIKILILTSSLIFGEEEECGRATCRP
eukprot:TRINITY_DN3562_c0_g5_i2.p1 TRINITY_DN3562_c0_g5~~TRINITY_DN3562_c0_g5_i2.p1  ORF type:complete len:262 (+),score=32.77 TRINITY_DN3562_c0_g5_i2:1186-1971(+)